MSQNSDPAREHVRRLAREIELLADAGGPPDTFFSEFLGRLVSVLGAQAGAVWLRDNQNRMGLQAEVNLAATGFFENPEARKNNDKILTDVLETGQASVKAPDADEDLPTKHVLLLASLQRQKQVVGVVQVFQRPDSPKEARPGYLQFMEQMCGHASRYLEKQEASKTQGSSLDYWKQFERFVLQIQRGLNSSEIAHVAVNDARELLQCDRVSLAVRRGDRTRIRAISGTDAVNRRANLVRMMARLAHKVTATGEPLLYTGTTEQFAPQIEVPLTDYIQESGSRMVQIIPLKQNAPLILPDEDDKVRQRKQKKPRKVIGALIIEQIAESRPRPGLTDRSPVIAEHVSAALDNSLSHERLFLLPVWRVIGDQLERIRGKRLRRVLAITLLVVAATCALVLVPWEYRAEGKGRLMPKIQRDVFATWDGEVVEILVESGQRVKANEPLIRLRNEDLQAKLLAARNELNEQQQLLFALQAQADEAVKKADKNQEIEVQGKIVQTRIQIEGNQEQVQLLQSQVNMLEIRSPIDGLVATFQLDQLLKNRPVQRGEKLLEVMDDTGPWRLELEVPESRMGHVLRQQRALGREDLPVEFLLATNHESTYHGTLEASATRSVVAEGEGTVVESFADIDSAEMPLLKDHLRIGAEVRAKISCGQKSLGYVLFGDVIEWVLKRWMLW